MAEGEGGGLARRARGPSPQSEGVGDRFWIVLSWDLKLCGESGRFGSKEEGRSKRKFDAKPCSSWLNSAGLKAVRYELRVFVSIFAVPLATAGNSTDAKGWSKKDSPSWKVSNEWSGDVV